MTNFTPTWAKYYGALPPLAHRLREFGDAGWVRIHSLPGMKRYAETEAEAAEVAHRARAMGDAVLGKGARCELLMTEKGGKRQAAAYRAARKAFGLVPAGSFTDPDGYDLVWSTYAAKVDWPADAFAPLLHAIATDRIAHVLWLGEDGAVFAPYDGGVDAFVGPTDRADALKARFADWRSPRADGL